MTTPVTVSGHIAAEIRIALARQDMSRRELARRLEVDPMWVSRRLTGQQSFTVEDVVRIATALDIDARSLLDLALTP